MSGANAEFTQQERLVVLLRYCDELTVEETAAALGVSEADVRRIDADVLRRIRERLARERAAK